MEALDSGMESCSIRFPKRDKKAEKQKILEFQTAWEERLEIEENPATVLAILLPMVIAKVCVWNLHPTCIFLHLLYCYGRCVAF